VTEVILETQVGADLISALSGIRRSLRRRVGRTGGVADLTEAQRDLVRVVRRRPGIRVGEAAGSLHLAANTVSTLVSALSTLGWLRRDPDPRDARSASLQLTTEAEARVVQWRDRRLAVLNDALADLSAEDLTRISRAVPALLRLAERLESSE
jgi:DNA-binding MarR family transcriptional regulator